MPAKNLYDSGNGVVHAKFGEGYVVYTSGDDRYGVQFAHGTEHVKHAELEPCPRAAQTRQSNRKQAMNAGYAAAEARKRARKAERKKNDTTRSKERPRGTS